MLKYRANQNTSTLTTEADSDKAISLEEAKEKNKGLAEALEYREVVVYMAAFAAHRE